MSELISGSQKTALVEAVKSYSIVKMTDEPGYEWWQLRVGVRTIHEGEQLMKLLNKSVSEIP